MKISSCQTRRVTSLDVHSSSQGEISSSDSSSWADYRYLGGTVTIGGVYHLVERASRAVPLFSLSASAVRSLLWGLAVFVQDRAVAECNAVIELRNFLC